MLSSRKVVCVGILASIMLTMTNAANAAPKTTPGKVVDVTLYRGQAMVTREIALGGNAGPMEIVVTGLPEHIVSDSLFAEGSETVEVRAVRFRTRAVGEARREEVRRLDDQISALSKRIAVNQKTQTLLTKQLAYLDQMEGFVAPTAKVELSQGVLDADALEQITSFSFEQRRQILEKQVENETEAKELSEQLSLLNRKRAELTNDSSQTIREAVVFAEKKDGAAETIRLAYLVNNCGWSPSYSIRAGEDRSEIQVECNALIHQMSGEDWGGVELTLSTASPALSAAAPGLAPFPVSLVAANQQNPQGPDLATQLQSIRMRQQDAIVNFQNTLTIRGNFGSNWDANAAANEFQSLELLNPKSALSAIDGQSTEADGPSLAYHIATPVSLPSRTDQQMVRIVQTKLPSKFHHIATPVLTSYVYREAELTNNSDEDMLGRPDYGLPER